MAENPFGEGLSDFGLLSQVSGDVLGSPNKVAELQSQLGNLQAVLSQAPPAQNTPIEAAIRGALGAASAPDIFVDPLTGQEVAGPPNQGGVGSSFLQGALAGIEGSQVDALARYEKEQEVALRATQQREAIATSIRTLLGQNPQAFEEIASTEDGRRAINMLAFGTDLGFDPTAKSREKSKSILDKQRIDYYAERLKDPSLSPTKRAEIANYMNDIVDPDGDLEFGPDDYASGKMPDVIKVAETYGQPGVEALQNSPDYPTFLAKIAMLKPIPKSSRSGASGGRKPLFERKLEAAVRVDEIQREHQELTGKPLTREDAVKQMTPEERAVVEQFLRDPGDDVPWTRYLDIRKDARRRAEEMSSDPGEVAALTNAFTRQEVNAARNMEKQNKKATAKIAPPPPAPKADYSKFLQEVKKRAGGDPAKAASAAKEVVDEYIRAGREDEIPASVRKKVGI